MGLAGPISCDQKPPQSLKRWVFITKGHSPLDTHYNIDSQLRFTVLRSFRECEVSSKY